MKEFIIVLFRQWKRPENVSFTLGFFRGKNVSQMAIKGRGIGKLNLEGLFRA